MTDKHINESIEKILNPEPQYLIMRRGYYFRINAGGYTGDLKEAWRVPLDIAKFYENLRDAEPVTIELAPARNYCNDLNLVRELELTLDENEQRVYSAILHRGSIRAKNDYLGKDFDAINKRPWDKCLAFLETKEVK